MKKIFLIVCTAMLFTSCNNEANKETTSTDSSATSSDEKIDYAYSPVSHEPDYWKIGDQKNVAMVLKALKAWENGNAEESLKYFADSVAIAWDGFEGKVSKDTLRSWFNQGIAERGSLMIRMDDYETVASKDGKETWVALWYREAWTDKQGKTDSVYRMDDLKIMDGKIVVLDQKSRKFPAAKK